MFHFALILEDFVCAKYQNVFCSYDNLNFLTQKRMLYGLVRSTMGGIELSFCAKR